MLSKEYDIDGRNPWELEPYYSRHVIAMTREELHGKSDIACELAFRDKRIADVEAELLSLREQLAELKEWATNRAITDDARENENYTTLKIDYRQRQLRELLKAAKPSED